MTTAPRSQPADTTSPASPLGPSAPEPKPLVRGWIHAVMAPLALAAGVVLVVLAPSGGGKTTSAVYALTGVMLFAVSATYHLGNWSPGVKRVLKRLDHTNIMLVIAGSYTPLAWALLPQTKATALLVAIWIGALAGVGFRVFWTDAPRWLYTPVYVLLGLASLLFIGDFFAANQAATVLLCAGGAFYIAGAVFYALKRPNFSERWFGFHELFHAFTVAGFTCHYIAITMAVLGTA
ncbi:PAQR family membrane homeostasis protein TrhA [Paeniglutamicibacter sp. R2-26]|uniref:PAQR family membrane homeostasis protein TrhA n=1 Tax=Paeniglutamicibacter sp. R2-26 TaxID=3144417 RepID=UPI003EE54B1E